MISKAAKARKAERAKLDLQRMLPRGTAIFVITRDKNDNGATLDVFKLEQWKENCYSRINLNISIAELGIGTLTSRHYVRMRGTNTSLAHNLVSLLGDYLWNDPTSLNCNNLG